MDTLIIGLIVPLLGTAVGAAAVYLVKRKIPLRLEKLFMGFASGLMIATAVWELILPSMEMISGSEIEKSVPVIIGMIAGVVFLLVMDRFIPHAHDLEKEAADALIPLSRIWKLVLAVVLHNIPEGMAIGISFAGVLNGNVYLSVAGAMALSIGIAIHNLPEGAIVSVPLKESGYSRNRSFMISVLSGVVQPVAAVITLMLASMIEPWMPYMLSFAAGAILFVVVEELIPASVRGVHSNFGAVGFSFGFILMLLLDALLE